MAFSVYLLCALTSAFCAVLLFRHSRRARVGLLVWGGAAFTCFAVANILLFLDLVVIPTIDLASIRNGITLIGIGMFVYGLIWETK